jgi:hypothetical protein
MLFHSLQKTEIEALLSSCSEAEAGGVTFRYMDEADDVYAFLVATKLTPLPALPALPASSTAPESSGTEVSSCALEDSTGLAVDIGTLSCPHLEGNPASVGPQLGHQVCR